MIGKKSVSETIKDLITDSEKKSVSTKLYTKRSGAAEKTVFLHQFGSRLYTSEAVDKYPGAANVVTLEQLPGSASKFAG